MDHNMELEDMLERACWKLEEALELIESYNTNSPPLGIISTVQLEKMMDYVEDKRMEYVVWIEDLKGR